MTEARSYTVVGAGAVGLLYGARLTRAGHPVRWLVRRGVEEMVTDGIRVSEPDETWTVDPARIEVATAATELPTSDVVLVATKTTGNDELGDLVRGVCTPGATVALFQNGLGAEERIRDEVPAAGAVVGAMCFVCARRTGPGRVDHLDYGAVTLAPLQDQASGSDTAGGIAAADIAADLRGAGVDAQVAPELGPARWRKLVWNIPFNGLCTVLGSRTDELLTDPGTRALVADLMDEVIAGAGAVGHHIDPGFRDEMLATTDVMTPYAPSMKLDHGAGRPLEVHAIYDVATDAARRAGAPMVRTETLAQLLHHLDTGRRSG